MLPFEYTRIEVKENLKIVSSKSKTTIEAETIISVKKSSDLFRIPLTLSFLVEYVIDYLVRILVAILS